MEFPFPFEPYSIQKDFMANLYECCEKSKLGIFESPTGTGKSLSLICGSLKWLKDFEEKRRVDLKTSISTLEAEHAKAIRSDDEDWLTSGYRASQIQAALVEAKKSLQSAEELDRRVQNLSVLKIRKDYNALKTALLKNVTLSESGSNPLNDESEAEDSLEPLQEDIEEEETWFTPTQVVFASRTHSQLSQFLGEIRKSPYSETRAITLASRANLCINQSVLKLGNPSFINERCLEMKQSSSKVTKKSDDGNVAKKQRKGKSENLCSCPFLRADAVQALADVSLTKVMDVEDLKKSGEDLKACPYYASRKAVELAELVALPYNILLHSKTRKTCGIKLKGSVVIIDEAHNLADTVASIHNAKITGEQLCLAYSQVNQYHDKFRTRFSPRNKVRITQVIFVLSKLLKILGGKPGKCSPEDSTGLKEEEAEIISSPNFVFKSNLDALNLFELVEFCGAIRLPQKLYGYREKNDEKPSEKPPVATPESKLKAFLTTYAKPKEKKSSVPENEVKEPEAPQKPHVRNSPLLQILEFVEALTNRDVGGKIVIKKTTSFGTCSLQYMLLDTSEHFKSIVDSARAIIVAGGTMKPGEEFRHELFANQPETRLMEFSCGHVVPASNICCLGLAKGCSGKNLEFVFEKRAECIKELGATLCAVTNLFSGGFVVFFPSYGFEAEVVKIFSETGVLEKLRSRKAVFREPKNSSDVDKVLSAYAKSIETTGGAMLFAVIGGKMSEGINFGDDLGRCVAVVGLPYPNSKSPELQEKLKHLDEKRGPGSGKKHYENLCLKALNQSIGRAIRHKADYAAILLLDTRYGRPDIQRGLPAWIRGSFSMHSEFRTGFSSLRDFFRAKKDQLVGRTTVLSSRPFSSVSVGDDERKRSVSCQEARRFMIDCMISVGTDATAAASLANTLVAADERGHFSHGLNRLEMYVNDIKANTCDGSAIPVILKESPATAWVDGNNALGPVVGNFCMQLAINKAKQVGVGWVTAKGSNHYGIAGWYSEQAVAEGLVGISMTNTSPLVAPTRGKKPALGTNPLAVAAPGGFNLDMATSAVAVGKLEIAHVKEAKIPPGWALDAQGNTATDPAKALPAARGVLLPLGGDELHSGYKGYGLGLMVDLFCGILGGSAYGPNIRMWLSADSRPANLGQCFAAIDPSCFSSDYESSMKDLAKTLRSFEPVDPEKSVLIAGDPERSWITATEKRGGILYHQNQLSRANSAMELMEDLSDEELKQFLHANLNKLSGLSAPKYEDFCDKWTISQFGEGMKFADKIILSSLRGNNFWNNSTKIQNILDNVFQETSVDWKQVLERNSALQSTNRLLFHNWEVNLVVMANSDTWSDMQEFIMRKNSLMERMQKRKREREGLLKDVVTSSSCDNTGSSSGEPPAKFPDLKPDLMNCPALKDPAVEFELLSKLCDASVSLPIDASSLIQHISGVLSRQIALPVVTNLLKKFAVQELITVSEVQKSKQIEFQVTAVEYDKLWMFANEIRAEVGEVQSGQSGFTIQNASTTSVKKEAKTVLKDCESSAEEVKPSAPSKVEESTVGSSAPDDIMRLLSMRTTKERETKKLGEEILELLSKPTAKERSTVERFRSQGGTQVQEFCSYGTRDECVRARLKLSSSSSLCRKLHFRKIIQKHTDEALGDCSFLNTCFHMDSCKYVHYQVDYEGAAVRRDEKEEVLSLELADSTSAADIRNKANEVMMRPSESTVLLPPQWIQSDLRFFDMSILGKFSVVMADPPWDIHMELPYGTMSDDEMRQLNVPCLQDDGLIFLWVTGRAMELGRECLSLWGYERVDELIWVKTNQLQRIIRTGRTGHWLNHGKEHCLVGMKGNPDKLNRGLDCDVIVAEVRATSHKPDEIYGIIERLSPGTRKIELFGRQHNAQPNWITLGNQLDGIRLVDPELEERFKVRYPEGNAMTPPKQKKKSCSARGVPLPAEHQLTPCVQRRSASHAAIPSQSVARGGHAVIFCDDDQ
ncbi:unnamed protein product [Notodromas monacha]|uniref:Helicase ATP-binding domain-containing protein n=1 Tax=Notodromas monacha TaxID=399045 RepID=A0A7R9BL69_9CRUS|nr:unnamed protein product [Notodromas monacha]CAG0916040.1 unnamed protein product [Notodromas monacha]